MAKRFLVLIALLLLGFYIAGCAEGDSPSTVTNPNPNVFAPTGSISGVVFDFCTPPKPVAGATVSVAYAGRVHSVVTGKTGGFSFVGVPANFRLPGPVANDDDDPFYYDDGAPYYLVTCDLTTVTGNPYGYTTIVPVEIYFTDLGDGADAYPAGEDTKESGSGASTPVNNLASTVNFAVAPPNASISGTVYDVSTGLVASAGTTVLLYKEYDMFDEDWETVFATTTTAANGQFTFDNVVPMNEINGDGNYYLDVRKADYCVVEGDNSIWVDCGEDKIQYDLFLSYEPLVDKTIPFITSIVVPGGPIAAQGGSYFGDILDTTTPLATFVVRFSEAMATNHTVKNAIDLDSSFAGTLTSAGGGLTHAISGVDIVASFAVNMTSTGVLTVTPTYKDGDELEEEDGDITWGDGVTVTYTGGNYELELWPQSIQLTDASGVPWAPSAFDGFYLGEPCDAIFFQDYYLMRPENISDADHEWFFWIGIGADQYPPDEYDWDDYGSFDCQDGLTGGYGS